MEEYIFNLIDYVSLETIIISFLVFLITMLVKIPIKRITSKLTELKRKALNSVIVLIPIILAIAINVLYFKFSKSIAQPFNIISSIFNSWLISTSLYTIFERIKVIINCLINKDTDEQIIIETESAIKNDLKELLTNLDNNEHLLEQVQIEISNLINSKEKIQTEDNLINLTKLFETNLKIQALTEKENNIENEITNLKRKLKNTEEN